jgi:hypothetical protein
MADLPKGYSIQTRNFKTVRAGEKLGEGGPAVYRVDSQAGFIPRISFMSTGILKISKGCGSRPPPLL